MKTITFLLMYYLPELPTTNYIFEGYFDQYLAKGYRVNIIAPNPTRGVTREQIKAHRHEKYRQIRENVHLYRVNCFTYHRYSKLNLLLRYLSVSFRCARRLKRLATDEVFIQTSPPIFYAYLASKIAKRRKLKIIYNVQDIYPDNIFKPKTLAYRLINHYQKVTLNNADEIHPISQDMANTLAKKGDFSTKMSIWPNRATFPITEYAPEKVEAAKAKFAFDDQKISIVYAGNIGYLQDLDVLVAAANLLQDLSNVEFKIIGEGAQALRIKDRIAQMKFPNCRFYPMASNEESAYVYHLASINFVSLLPGVIYTACPLKTAMLIQAGKPIIACVDEESVYAADLLKQGAIKIVPHRDYHLLAASIREFAAK